MAGFGSIHLPPRQTLKVYEAMDLSPIVPEARPIVTQVAEVYLRHTAPWFVGLLIHGSALKGGFISGCSDVDFQLYLAPPAFERPGRLPLTLAFAIQRDVARIDPAPFRYIQCYPFGHALPPGHVGPIPGAYHLIAGRLPVPEATAKELQTAAVRSLHALDPDQAFSMSGFLGHGAGRFQRKIRLLCTVVWPVLYQVLALQSGDPVAIWRLPKAQAIQRLPAEMAVGAAIRDFHRAVRVYYPSETSQDQAFTVIQTGLQFLYAARSWWQERNDAWPTSAPTSS